MYCCMVYPSPVYALKVWFPVFSPLHPFSSLFFPLNFLPFFFVSPWIKVNTAVVYKVLCCWGIEDGFCSASCCKRNICSELRVVWWLHAVKLCKTFVSDVTSKITWSTAVFFKMQHYFSIEAFLLLYVKVITFRALAEIEAVTLEYFN